MSDVIIDTNVVIWYFTLPVLPSMAAQSAVSEAFQTGTIFVSAISVVELIFLVEKRRIPKDVLASLKTAFDAPSSAISLCEITREVCNEVENIPRTSIPDMPDRIIAASALHLDLPLITSDEAIRKLTNIQTIW